MMGVPVADRDEVRRLADLLVHREDGRTRRPAGRHGGGDRAVRATTATMVTAAAHGADRRPHLRAGRAPRSTATGSPTPRSSRSSSSWSSRATRRPPSCSATRSSTSPPTRTSGTRSSTADGAEPGGAVGRGDAALRQLHARCWPATSPTTSSCTVGRCRPGPSCCSCSARPTGTSGSSPTRRSTTSTGPRTSSRRASASAPAATSAWAPTSPGSRPGSCSPSWSAASIVRGARRPRRTGALGQRARLRPAAGHVRREAALMGKYDQPERRPAVVAGASSGIGAETAKALAAAGFRWRWARAGSSSARSSPPRSGPTGARRSPTGST